DADTGVVRWVNDGDGSTFQQQPHSGANAFGGIAPQGSLVVAGDRLLVPGGRSVPACYDRRTGKLLHYRLAENSKRGGGPAAATDGSRFANAAGLFALATGKHLAPVGGPAVFAAGRVCALVNGELRAYDTSQLQGNKDSVLKSAVPPPVPATVAAPPAPAPGPPRAPAHPPRADAGRAR